ncbi:MAG: iron-sulfur cluster assembly protein [Anaerolineaceae bacterium]|nr:iron-sulfur cluster assembly protein [Anaerolineaceae bacterium]
MSNEESKPRNLKVWSVQEKYPGLCRMLEEALNKVMDPELGLSMMQLGLIRDVEYIESEAGDEDEIIITMILTTPFCPYAPSLIQQVEQAAEQVLSRVVTLNMGHEVWEPDMMEEGLGEWGLF